MKHSSSRPMGSRDWRGSPGRTRKQACSSAQIGPRHPSSRSGLTLPVVLALLLLIPVTLCAFAVGTVRQVTLVMQDFNFAPVTVSLKTGEAVALTIRNEGVLEHDWTAGKDLVPSTQGMGYRTDLWEVLRPRVIGKGYTVERAEATPPEDPFWEMETAEMLSTEVDVEPGGWVTLRFTVPASAKGTWQFASFVLRQDGLGMQGTLIIE